MKKLVVTIQDFSPRYNFELYEMLDELDMRGIKKRTTVVIPNLKDPDTEKHYPLNSNQKSIDMLLKEQEAGNEFCLHGYDHSMGPGRKREFKRIDFFDARTRIVEGLDTIESLGINPAGFVPPFWKISKEGKKAVKDAGFRFIEYNGMIRDLATGRPHISRALWGWPHSSFLDVAFRAYDKFLAFVQDDSPLMRVALHPQDLWKNKPFYFLLDMIEKLRKDRILTSYSKFLGVRK